MIGTKLAQELNVKPGDEIEVDTTQHGKQKLRVAALAIDYMVGGEIILYLIGRRPRSSSTSRV